MNDLYMIVDCVTKRPFTLQVFHGFDLALKHFEDEGYVRGEAEIVEVDKTKGGE